MAGAITGIAIAMASFPFPRRDDADGDIIGVSGGDGDNTASSAETVMINVFVS